MMPKEPKIKQTQAMNYRDNPLNNRLALNRRTNTAVLYCADGSRRIYRVSKKITGILNNLFQNNKGIGCEYLLEEEISSSGQITTYTYNKDETKVTISNGCSTVCVALTQLDEKFKIEALCSDGKKIYYSGTSKDQKRCLTSVEKGGESPTFFNYHEDKGLLYRKIKNIAISQKEVLSAKYYTPVYSTLPNGSLHISRTYGDGKVKSIYRNGEKVSDFFYDIHRTMVRDSNGFDTIYTYPNGVITKIQYPDGYIEQFFWNSENITKKTYHDKEGKLVFTKTFVYDQYKNVIEEKISGDQSYTKWYTYNRNQLCVKEREESGLTFHYEYLKSTDLVTCKKTCNGDVVLLEERTVYDDKHLVKEKISFDGFREKRTVYTLDPETGLVTEMNDGLHTVCYEYNSARQLIRETTKYATITSQYDAVGRLTCKTYPLGGKEEYVYDECGNPTQIKMIGSPKKTITYDKFHRPISCEVDGRVSHSKYDQKGNIIEEIDYKGASTTYAYDCFGRCIKKTLPLGDETLYEYDGFGNVVKETSPNGHITKTSYNMFHKPTHILFADGSQVFHLYSANGNLLETTLQDESKIFYRYDLFGRLIYKKQGGLEESFEYEGAVLKKVTSSNGLVTVYDYDEFGRKISEDVGGRKKEFFYDEMNLVYKTRQEDVTTIELHDIEGRVIKTHTNGKGIIEYTYDQEGRKSKATKTTSCGEAEDHFAFDFEGRLISHIDPLGQKTLFLYEDYKRTEVDPLGHQTVEYFDLLSRVIEKQKLDASGNLLLSETFTYDKEGNVVRRFTKEHNIDVTYQYDCMNRLIEEVECGKKITCYKYDKKGRLVQKSLPNGVEIFPLS